MKMFNTKNKTEHTKNSDQTTKDSLKNKLLDIQVNDKQTVSDQDLSNMDLALANIEIAQKAYEAATNNLQNASKLGNVTEINKAKELVDKAREEVQKAMEQAPQKLKDGAELNDLQTKNEEENEMKKNNEKVTAEDVKGAVKSEMIAEGEATKEQLDKEANTEAVNAKAEQVASEINKANEDKKPEDNKQEDKKPEDNKPANKNSKELIPKAWQRVSDDGKSLINVITFLGTKVDYSVGMKHKYAFPNLSVSDGMNRIVTAKFPKEDTKPVAEHIEFKGYTIDIEKYGNSAVCKLYDPDNICMLEFVSLATVIDVLQDELNPTNECVISWGTIDQIIKFKRGLKSRIKSLGDNDEPARQRGGAKKEETVEATAEVKSELEAAPTDANKEEAPKEEAKTGEDPHNDPRVNDSPNPVKPIKLGDK